ncbi:hypothetical protein [Fluviicola sp.]|uniref:toxin-antitoxin system YwqK family antitoxin n=1 Tax=Fluviicola sp. TaxID=1917219 RepID=UPI0031D8CF81
MKTTFILCMLGFSLSTHAGTLFDQLCAFNPNWSNYRSAVPAETQRVFLSDKQIIQTHLGFVLELLKSADTRQLNQKQVATRTHLLAVLSDYRLQGNFPVNYYRPERIPVFIDEHQTHCAVGYLMQQTGFENLAQQISKADNYVWVKDLKGEQVLEWQQLSGFSLEELKLIQGAYDSYMPFALEAPNRIEIPQKPEVIALNFKQKDLDESSMEAGKTKIWIRGEGKDGVLHGRWEQNYSPELPWIVGFYQHGKREGKWLEYYRGTNQLCRTEHWKNDKLNGIRTRFDRNGNVIEEILFENGNAVLKTNYELLESLKYVRKPVGENKVWTEIYNPGGRLIACGHETIHNPGNLQWFQNIELTALNTMSLASQSYTQSPVIISVTRPYLKTSSRSRPHSHSHSHSVSPIDAPRLYEEPPLVEYIKEGDWVYQLDVSNDYLNAKSRNEEPVWLFMKRFNRFGKDLFDKTIGFGGERDLAEFDSLHVNYSNGDINAFNGFYGKQRFRMEFEHYSAQNLLEQGSYYPIHFRYGRGRESYYSGAQLKSIGFVNENDEKIRKWQHFNPYGELERVEEFILPQKKEVTLRDRSE